MALEIKKQDGESSQGLVRRFSKHLKMSGILRRTRRSRFFQRVKSENMKKRSALRREESRKEYDLDQKMNKPEERVYRR